MPITRECFMSKTLDNQLFDIAEVLSDSSGYPIPSRPCFNEMTIDYQLYNLWRAWGGGATVLLEGLLAFYKLSDLTDSSGNNRTLTNNDNVSFASGKIGNAAVFDVGWLSSEETIDFTGGFSVGCWVNISSSDSLHPAVSQWQGGLGAFYIGTANEQYVFATCHDENVSNPTWLYGGTAALNEWVYMVGTYDGTTEKLYVNNVLIASQPTSQLVNPSVGQFKIGTFDDGGEFVFNGSIDAVGIWNRALSNAEITLLYNNGNGIELP